MRAARSASVTYRSGDDVRPVGHVSGAGILAAIRLGLSNGRLEGLNSRCTRAGSASAAYEQGSRMPWGHRHREQKEVYVVVAGTGRAKPEIEVEVVKLAAWDMLRAGPAVARPLALSRIRYRVGAYG